MALSWVNLVAKKIILKHNSPEWLAFRQKGIGGSDAAAVLGISKWKTNQELWEEKVGIRQPKDISDNYRVRYGTDAEKHLIGLFALQYADRYKTKVNKRVIYLKDGFQFASLDGELKDLETGELGIYEGKTVEVSSSLVWEEWKDKIPQAYYVQLLHQLLVTGWKFNIISPEFRWLDKDGEWTTKVKRIIIRTSDPNVLSDMKYLDEAEHEFWDKVQKGERPALQLPDF